MDAPCKIQGSIHVFRLVNNMCPGKWVHITVSAFYICQQFPILPGRLRPSTFDVCELNFRVRYGYIGEKRAQQLFRRQCDMGYSSQDI